MKTLFILFVFILSGMANDQVEKEVNDFLRRLDGNYKERKEASKQLNNLPVEFYPYLKEHLKKEDIALEVKLRLTKDKMYPLRAKWLHKKRMEWFHKNLIEAYEKFGHKNKKWDADARKTLELAYQQFDEYWIVQGYAEAIGKASQNAMRKGCKDPLILYLNARSNVGKLYDYRKLQLKKLHLNAAKALRDSQYHPFFKFRVTRLESNYTRYRHNQHVNPNDQDKKRCLKLAESAVPFLKQTLEDPDMPFKELFYNVELLSSAFEMGGKSRMDGFNKVKPILEERFGKSSMELKAIEGSIGINYVSEIRRNSYEESKRAKAEYENILEEAWEMDPARKDIALRLLKSIRKDGNSERFNKWYQNILIAEPDNYDAYKIKMEFLSSSGSVEDYWEYAEEIAEKGGLMVRNLPKVIWKIGAKLSVRDNEKILDFDVLYKNQKMKSLVDKGFSKAKQDFPDNKNLIIEHAESLASMYFWEDAYKLFEEAGNVNQYKGRLSTVVIQQRRNEAELYVKKGFKELTPHFINYKERIQQSFEANLKLGIYKFWQYYRENNKANEKWDLIIEPYLKQRERSFCGDPSLAYNDIENFHKPFKMIGKLREEGNKDPLLYMFWSDVKDNWHKGSESHYYKAATQMAKSNYPDNIKLYAACNGISRLSNFKNISEDIKKDVVQLCQKIPFYVDDKFVNTELYYKLFDGLKDLNLLSEELARPIIDAYKKAGKMSYALMVESHFYSQMGWYTHKQSKKKNWKKINEFNRKSDAALEKAWLLDPYNANIAENLFIKSDRFKKDFGLKLQRALYTLHSNFTVLKDFMSQSSSSHSASLDWANYPHKHARFQLLHYFHTERKAKYDKDERMSHWDDVSRLFENYLKEYPNDTVSRSRYAMFAIHCNKDSVVKEQLKVLGEYTVDWAFGGTKKLKEYQSKYLKE